MVLLIYSKPLGIYTVGLSFSLCVPQEIPVPFQTSDAFQISPGDTFKRETLFYLCFPAWFRYSIRHIVFSLLKKKSNKGIMKLRESFQNGCLGQIVSRTKWIVCYFSVEFKDILPKISTFRSYNMFYLILPILDLRFSSEFSKIAQTKAVLWMVGRAREGR